MILPANKGNATVVMNSSDYKQKLKNLLDDTTVYEVLEKDQISIRKTQPSGP